MSRAMPMGRRAFIAGGLGTAGALVLGSCSDDESGAPSGSGDDQAPAARPTLRLAGGDFGFPSPFGYSRVRATGG